MISVDNIVKRSDGKSIVELPGGKNIYFNAGVKLSTVGDFIYLIDEVNAITYTIDFNNTNLEKHSQTSAKELMNYWADNNFFFSRSGGSGGVIVINQNHVFTLFTDRDDYFDPTLPVGNPTDNTAELIANNTLILITGEGSSNIIQRWDGVTDPVSYENTNWTDVTDTVRGPAGADGADGRSVLNGAVDPTTEGVDGDFYINTASNEIFGPKASGTWPSGVSLVGPTGPAGSSEIFEDVTFTTSLTLNPANLTTYNKKNVIYTGTVIATITLDAIANFIADPETDIRYRIINEANTPLSITANTGETIGNTSQQTITLQRGQSLYIKVPTSGTRWDRLAGQTNLSGGTTIPPANLVPQAGSVILRTSFWDASSGSFPAGTIKSGALYQVSTAGTVDNEEFFVDDLLLAVTDNPSTTTFAGNWHRIDGDEYVHSWGGLTGIIDDNAITTVLSRLGFSTSGTRLSAISNFVLNDIASRIDLNVSLVGNHSITFDINDPTSYSALVLNMNAVAIHTFTLSGLQAGSNTVTDVNISSAEWSAITGGSVTDVPFQLVGTLTGGGTVRSNTVTVERRDLNQHEFFYYGRTASTADPTTIDVSTLTPIELSIIGQQSDITIPTGDDNDKIIILIRASHTISSIVNTGTGLNSISEYTKVDDDQVINSFQFDSYELDGLRASYTATLRLTITTP